MPQSEFAKRSRWRSRQIALQSSNTAAEVSARFSLSCKRAKEGAVNVSYIISLQAKDLAVNSLLKFPRAYTHTSTYVYLHIFLYVYTEHLACIELRTRIHNAC